MSPRVLLTVLIAAAVLHTAASPAGAARYYMRKSGNDRSAGTSRSTAWKTLTRLSKQRMSAGDIVYVGAGVYRGSFTPVGGGVSNRPARIYADTRGRYTGDRGAVVFAPLARRWQTTLTRAAAIRFDNVTFDSQTDSAGAQGFGVYARKGSLPIQFVNCTFQQLRYAAWSTAAPLQFYGCRFRSNTAADVVLKGRAGGLLRACVMDHSQGNGHGVLIYQQATVSLDQCRFTSGRFGVYSNGDTGVTADRCVFKGTRYPVYGRAQSASIANSTVIRATTGVYLTSTSTPTRVENVRVSSSQIGLQVPTTGYRLSRVTLDRNRIALWLHPQLPRFEVQKSTRLTLQKNQYGIYLPKHKRPAGTDVTLRGITFAGHTAYAILTYDADLSIRDCRFRGNRYGVYSANSRSCEIRNTPFERHTSGWAIVATGRGIDICDCLFPDNRNTMYLRPGSGENPVLRNIAISRSRIGIRVDGGKLQLPAASNVTLTNTTTGMMFRGSDADLNGITIRGGTIGLDVRSGQAALKNITVSGSGYGVIARNVRRLTVDGLNSQNNRNWGLYAKGQDIQVARSVIDGNRNGVYLQENSGDRLVSMTDTQITNGRGYGLLMAQCSLASIADLNLSIRNNTGAGITVMGRPLTLSPQKTLDVSGNGTGIYAVGAGVNVNGVTLNNNGIGIRTVRGDIRCQDVTISGGRYGVYQTNAAACILTDTTISKAELYGLVVSNSAAPKQRVDLANVTLVQNRRAAYVNGRSDGTLTVSGCDFSRNSGHGLLSYRAGTQITKSTVSSNGADGIIHIDGPMSVTESTFDGNRSYTIRVYSRKNAAGTRVTVRNCRLRNSRVGVGMRHVHAAEIVNNVITGNRYGVISHTSGLSADVWNNTLADNQIGVYHSDGVANVVNNIISYGDLKDADRNAWGIYYRSGQLDHRNNLLFGQTRKYLNTRSGNGDVIKPPRFRDRKAGDFRLAMGSPAINAGAPTKLVTDDASGVSRPLHGANEIGAFEFPERAGSVRILDWQELAADGS